MPDPFLRHLDGATVAVTGASGNLGTALLRRLTAPGSGVAEVRGLARRRPPGTPPYDGVRWHLADLGEPSADAEIAEFVTGADAVVHLAWALQPGRRPDDLRRVNVGGTDRVARAAAAAGVAHLVHLSSLGAYAPGAVGQRVTEDWPTTGIFVHADDVADALVRILGRRADGPFNLAAEPLMDAAGIARALGTTRVPVPAVALRTAVQAAFTTHLIPTEPGWLDIAVGAPALDSTRAHRLLDWTPEHRGDDVLARFVAALGRGEGGEGPLLHPADGSAGAP